MVIVKNKTLNQTEIHLLLQELRQSPFDLKEPSAFCRNWAEWSLGAAEFQWEEGTKRDYNWHFDIFGKRSVRTTIIWHLLALLGISLIFIIYLIWNLNLDERRVKTRQLDIEIQGFSDVYCILWSNFFSKFNPLVNPPHLHIHVFGKKKQTKWTTDG